MLAAGWDEKPHDQVPKVRWRTDAADASVNLADLIQTKCLHGETGMTIVIFMLGAFFGCMIGVLAMSLARVAALD